MIQEHQNWIKILISGLFFSFNNKKKYLEDDQATRGCVLEYARAKLTTAAMTSRCMKTVRVTRIT